MVSFCVPHVPQHLCVPSKPRRAFLASPAGQNKKGQERHVICMGSGLGVGVEAENSDISLLNSSHTLQLFHFSPEQDLKRGCVVFNDPCFSFSMDTWGSHCPGPGEAGSLRYTSGVFLLFCDRRLAAWPPRPQGKDLMEFLS